jgi:hypothetical protein
VVVLIAAVAYVALRNAEEEGDDAGSGAPLPTAPGEAPAAAQLLATLVVADEVDRGAYERQAFGDGWRIGEDGCDVRFHVLVEESEVPVARGGGDGCTVVRGEWRSLYDGRVTDDPAELEIDHLVPLAEAWDSGAGAWPAERRVSFANDTDRPDALIAVTAAMNQSKSDRDPAEWMPPDRGAWCRYADAYVRQKAAWKLTVDPAEHDALENALAAC